jgi:aquaporin Z
VSPLAPRIGGFGIGLMVAADILGGGTITGAAMNPARWLGTAVPAGFYDHWYVYFVGPLVGAAIAGLTYRYVFAPPPDLAPSKPVTPAP